MRIAVTGSSGFIGKPLVEALKADAHEVTEISRSKGFDIANWESVKDIPTCNIIIHLAARTFVPDSFDNPREFYHFNSTATLHAMELARKWKARVIHMSSYLYGPPQYLPVDERHSINPHNPYAQTKLISESIVEGYARDFKLNALVFRLFNLYGPKQDESFLIPTILKQVLQGKVILKDPRPKRDFIHIDDVTNAIRRSIGVSHTGFDIVNLGSGISYSVEEVVDLFKKHSSRPFEISYTNEYRQGEVLDSVACTKKINEVLNWRPQVSIEEGISQLLNHYK